MPERWVVNASPLIVLAKIEQLHLLTTLADEVIVPQAVVDEIMAGPVDDPARRFLETNPLKIIRSTISPVVQAWDLGKGETAVLSLAFLQQGWRAVVDDGAARRCARALDIPVIGTLGIILKAKQQDIIPAAAPLLRSLQAHGFRLNEQVIREALKKTVNEVWD